MVKHHKLSPLEREQLVQFFSKTKNASKTARHYHVNIKSVWRWVTRAKLGLGLESKRSSGRRQVMSDAACEEARRLLLYEQLTLSEAAQVLADTSATTSVVHQTTISRNIKKF